MLTYQLKKSKENYRNRSLYEGELGCTVKVCLLTIQFESLFGLFGLKIVAVLLKTKNTNMFRSIFNVHQSKSRN